MKKKTRVVLFDDGHFTEQQVNDFLYGLERRSAEIVSIQLSGHRVLIVYKEDFYEKLGKI